MTIRTEELKLELVRYACKYAQQKTKEYLHVN